MLCCSWVLVSLCGLSGARQERAIAAGVAVAFIISGESFARR